MLIKMSAGTSERLNCVNSKRTAEREFDVSVFLLQTCGGLFMGLSLTLSIIYLTWVDVRGINFTNGRLSFVAFALGLLVLIGLLMKRRWAASILTSIATLALFYVIGVAIKEGITPMSFPFVLGFICILATPILLTFVSWKRLI